MIRVSNLKHTSAPLPGSTVIAYLYHYHLRDNTQASLVQRIMNLHEAILQVLRGEREYVASHVGRSQYSSGAGGMSACGLAALNCARVALHQEKSCGTGSTPLLQRLMEREVCEVCD